MPLDKAHWGDVFGMCKDRFGVDWLVNVAAARLNGPSAAPAVRAILNAARTVQARVHPLAKGAMQ